MLSNDSQKTLFSEFRFIDSSWTIILISCPKHYENAVLLKIETAYIIFVGPTRDHPVGWKWRIHRLLFCRGVRPHHNDCPIYDTEQSDGEVPIMQELWEIQSTPSLPSLPGPLWCRVAGPDRVLHLGQIELNCVLMLKWIFKNRTVWHLTV